MVDGGLREILLSNWGEDGRLAVETFERGLRDLNTNFPAEHSVPVGELDSWWGANYAFIKNNPTFPASQAEYNGDCTRAMLEKLNYDALHELNENNMDDNKSEAEMREKMRAFEFKVKLSDFTEGGIEGAESVLWSYHHSHWHPENRSYRERLGDYYLQDSNEGED